MNTFFTALVLSAIITTISLFINNNKSENFNSSVFALKTYITSFIVIYVGLLYLYQKDSTPEIEIGEPGF